MKNYLRIVFIVLFMTMIVFVSPRASSGQKNFTAQKTEATSASRRALATIPFDLLGNHIYVKVSINGSAPLSFILDTGAGTSVVSLKQMNALKLESAGTIPIKGAGGNISGTLLKNANLSVVGIKDFKTPLMVAIPLAGLEAIGGQKIDGVLGHEFFRNFPIRIDYKKREIEVFDKMNFEYKGTGEVLPLIFKGRHPHVSGTMSINNEEFDGDFIIDIGSSQSLLLTTQFINDNNLLEKISPIIELPVSGGGVGGALKASISRIEKLQFGSIEIPKPLTTLSQNTRGAVSGSQNYIGNIGTGILKHFNVIFDFTNKQMILEKTSESSKEQKFNMSGILVRKVESDYKILGLLRDSPAVEAGLEVDDILHKINGVSASEFSLEQIQEQFKVEGKMSLEIKREGKTMKKELTLRTIL